MLKARGKVGILIRQHERFVHAGKGLVLRVLQKAGRAYCQGIPNLTEKFEQAVTDLGRERCRKKALFDGIVVRAVQSEIGQVIFAQEAIEDVCGQYNCRGHRDPHARKLAGQTVLAEQVTHECESARLAAERPFPNAQEKSICGRESGRANWIKSRRRCSVLVKSETLRGRSF
jgi:hypothetical protein